MSTWIKVYNSLPAHPKIIEAGDRAAWLFICGLCYCNEHLTDGFIPEASLPAIALGMTRAPRAAGRLVDVGLWHAVQRGWQVHQYEEYQRTSDEIRARQSWDAERQSLYRDKALLAAIRQRDGDSCRYCGQDVNWKDRRGPRGATYDHVIPRGGNTFENVVVACRRCNSSKGARTPEQAGVLLREVEPIQIVTRSDS